MSTISIKIDASADQGSVVRAVRPITGQAISEIRHAVLASEPIYERELFMNDFADVAETLRRLIGSLEKNGIDFEIWEVVHGETDSEEVSSELLLNMLEGSDDFG